MGYRQKNDTTPDENEGFKWITVKNNYSKIMTNWVGDSGSTYHVVNSRDHMYNTRSPNGDIVVGDGNSVKVELVGGIGILVTNRDGSKVKMTLKGVFYSTKMWGTCFQ